MIVEPSPILDLIPITDLSTFAACIIQPSAMTALSKTVPEIFDVGNILALVKIRLLLSYKSNLGMSSVKPIFASKNESIFPISVQYPSY